jgi:zinc protease
METMNMFYQFKTSSIKWLLLLGVMIFSSANAALPIHKLNPQNGVEAYLIQTKSLPMIDIEISIDAGGRYDPKGKSGLAAMTADLLDRGIILNRQMMSEARLADEIADLGANLSTGASGERALIKLRSLSRIDIRERAIPLLAAVLSNPIYDPKIIEREKQRTMTALREENTKPDVVLAKRFKRAVYGAYPLAESPSPQSIAAIQPSDLKRFYQDFYTKDRIIINLVGDLDIAEANLIAFQLSAELKNKAKNPSPLVKLSVSPLLPSSEREIQVVFDSQQTHIAMGMTGVARDHPDYFPLMVGNYVLGGGGFVSRLMAEVREKRGLAYSVYSYFNFGQDTGIFQAGVQTRNDQAKLSLQVLAETIGQFILNGPDDKELEAAKANLINGYPLRIDSNRKLLENLSAITWNRLPLDTMDTWTNNVALVSREQIQQAFKRHLDMQRMLTVVLGPQQK